MKIQIPTLSWADDLTAEQWDRNPYPAWARLRKEAPLAHLPHLGAVVGTSHEVCREVAGSPDFGAVATPAGGRTLGHPAVFGANGPIHAELRAMVDPCLQPAEVDRWVDDLVRPIARDCLARFLEDGRAELVRQYFMPLSVRVLGDAMGLYSISCERLLTWSDELSVSYTNVAVDDDGRFLDQGRFEVGDRAKTAIREAVDPLLDTWTDSPEDVWLSHWLHDGMPAGETRDWGHIYPTIYAFLLCAMQQPGSAMFATLVGLFSDPDQLAAVVADPTLIPRAVAEGMRWVAPAWCSTPRVAIADTEIAGFHVPKHTVIIQSYGSANHDETHWDTPTTFNLWRAADQHLAFGTGRRACPGGYFATAVCRIGLEELLRALPALQSQAPADGCFWDWVSQGPKELHVTWGV